jgi:hypothetical protein
MAIQLAQIVGVEKYDFNVGQLIDTRAYIPRRLALFLKSDNTAEGSVLFNPLKK